LLSLSLLSLSLALFLPRCALELASLWEGCLADLHVRGPEGLEALATIASLAEAQYGYIQRLAVHPNAQRNGYGRKLVLDAMQWLGSRGMQHALVNTDSSNAAALSLYDSLGFTPLSYSLYVLERACTD
jgi:ribosomal protein S18 acetylase RimI-like enzyme